MILLSRGGHKPFSSVFAQIDLFMANSAQPADTESWQGLDVQHLAAKRAWELQNVSLAIDLEGQRELSYWQADIAPNLPWADEHFEERVSGQPLNPPPSWVRWPWAGSAAQHVVKQFNHTYPERFWPKYAGWSIEGRLDRASTALGSQGRLGWPTRRGIRHEYGDLHDVVALLKAQPHTRQAYLPIFFPEDTGVGDGGRKPCTLGYLFRRRGNELGVTYYIRSCDVRRHLRDDCYLAVRLLLWVIDACGWDTVLPGEFIMHIGSLHEFAHDREKSHARVRA